MGLLGSIFGRRRTLPVENLAALSAAGDSLSDLRYDFAGKAGICMRKGPAQLDATGMFAGAGMTVRYGLATDEYGCTWIIMRGDLRTVVASMTTACRLLNEARHGGDILCVVFEFRKDDRKAYWIYSRKGLFYPFVPRDGEHDVARELKMLEAGTDVMPMEGSLSSWHPIWGMPF